jgi:hypothetical protein
VHRVDDGGRVYGVCLTRKERDAIRLGIDTIGIVPDASHLISLHFCPVVGSDQERYVVELAVQGESPYVSGPHPLNL